MNIYIYIYIYDRQILVTKRDPEWPKIKICIKIYNKLSILLLKKNLNEL